jgi:hypothetical protein
MSPKIAAAITKASTGLRIPVTRGIGLPSEDTATFFQVKAACW